MMTNDVYHEIFSLLSSSASDVTIITPNRRLAATLHEHYQQYEIKQQKKYWSTPDILPLLSWYERTWQEHVETEFSPQPLLLNQIQEQMLWETIIANTSQQHFLLQVSKTADLIQSAHALLQQWQITSEHPAFARSEDYLACREWIATFQKVCAQKNYLDHARLPNLLRDKIIAGEIPVKRTLIFVGFLEITPQLQSLIDALEIKIDNRIEKIRCFKLPEKNCTPIRSIYSDTEAEIFALASWAKQLHETSPNQTIGCVIPELDKIRDRVQQIFAEIFIDTASFNVTAGKPLTQYPVINAALQLLQIQRQKMPAAFFSYILHTPFLGHAEQERIARAKWEIELHQDNLLEIDLLLLLDKNHSSFNEKCSHLSAHLQHFFAKLSTFTKEKKEYSYRSWAEIFLQLLCILGWPGERSLNSEEYQVVESWLNLLSELKTLDQVTNPVTYREAWLTLNKLTRKKIFQPKTPTAPVQILGLLEAAALPFDALWLTGMNEMNWPEAAKPHPFIPKELQRELQMPHATAARELTYCQQLLNQFQQCAVTLFYSHAEKTTEIEVEASPLIKSIPITALSLPVYESAMQHIFRTQDLEMIIDSQGPAFLSTEKLRGGVSILKAQALCPFKAFAEWRLNALPVDNIQPGLRAKDRGIVIHRILEIIWQQIKDHATLCALPNDELQTLITIAIETTLASTAKKITETPVYFALEKTRLQKLMNEWLTLEKERPPFKVINHEKTAQMTFNQFDLTIRIDRIDELPDGKKLIIDYKTGKNNDINYWFSERPEEPQLPLYALLDTNITGIMFAQVTRGEHCFKGVSEQALDVNGMKTISDIKQHAASTWTEQIAIWQTTLQQLSDDFYQGKASVDPKHPTETCNFCTLKPLCRINQETRETTHESFA